MQAFEYANPATVREAVGMLGARWGEVDVLAGGTDLLSLMKEHIETPRRVVNIKNIKELGGIFSTTSGCRAMERDPVRLAIVRNWRLPTGGRRLWASRGRLSRAAR